jgi:hypothetical protein
MIETGIRVSEPGDENRTKGQKGSKEQVSRDLYRKLTNWFCKDRL